MKGPVNLKVLSVSAALLVTAVGSGCLSCRAQSASQAPRSTVRYGRQPWEFAVSGDSRNCGDVVMPGIAERVKQRGALFYWHLGDLRAIYDVDEDIRQQPEHLLKPLTKPEYLDMAWNDFIQNQISPFGTVPFYLGIGNHETIAPKDHAAFLAQFRSQLDLPNLRAQRLEDDPADLEPKTYYHWIERGVDFINLDNATRDQFDPEQIAWLEKTLGSDSANPRIRTIVVGMHEALPESLSKSHSMDQSEGGTQSGLRVYADLLNVQNKNHKRVYVLASHSHYFMDGTFNTDYWRTHGGILPGWIVGTAGAVRYALPPDADQARAAMTNVYGFLSGTVYSSGQIQFEFQRLNESDIPEAITARYTADFVHWCFEKNSQAPVPAAH
jgi:Calcineurin-like phosphoesterase